MEVKLIDYSFNGEKKVAAAARLCYSAHSAADIMENFSDREAEAFLQKLIAFGHFSPIEHASFTFVIDGVSRVLSHQLVRHRIGVSYSQKSQRYVQESGFDYVIPPSVAQNPEALAKFEATIETIRQAYSDLLQQVPAEDSRYLLPNATCTNLMVTFNARSLLHFLELRCCRRAQWEIRELAEKMLQEVRAVSPALFKNAGPTCETMGICFEGKMSCGRVAADKIMSRSE